MSDPRYFQEGFDKVLSHAIEEAGEFLAAAGKTQRWGLNSANPELPKEWQVTNEEWLRSEALDLVEQLGRLLEIMDSTNVIE